MSAEVGCEGMLTIKSLNGTESTLTISDQKSAVIEMETSINKFT